MKKEKFEHTKIIVKRSDGELEMSIPWDAGLGEWEEVFRMVLKWATFTDESIDEFFGDE